MVSAPSARTTPLNVVADSMIKEVGIDAFADDTSDVAWLQDQKDRSCAGWKRSRNRRCKGA